MAHDLDLRDIQTLTDLQTALGRFASGTNAALRAAEAEIGRTLEWLHERVGHWQRETERARREVAAARAALEHCLRSGYYDREGHYYPPNCSAEERALARAEAHLQECEGNLRTAQTWRSRIEQAANEYRREARRLDDVAGGHTEKARAQLGQAAANYEAVRTAASAVGNVGAVVAAALGISGTLSRPGSVPQSSQYAIAGDERERARLAESLQALEETGAGTTIAQTVREKGTTVRFGPIAPDVIAQYNRSDNAITINDQLRDAPSAVLAAHLAHEGTHVQWDKAGSIDQEYHAFQMQAEVWTQLKGNETDSQCDWVSGIIGLGEIEAKAIIGLHYWWLLE